MIKKSNKKKQNKKNQNLFNRKYIYISNLKINNKLYYLIQLSQ